MHPPSRARILVAGPNRTRLRTVERLLREADHEAIAAHAIDLAIAAINEARPDLVIVDHVEHGQPDCVVCRYVRETPALRSMPLILLVAADAPTDAVSHALRHGADACLRWPTEPGFLRAQIESLLARARSARQLERLVQGPFGKIGEAFFAAACAFLSNELGADLCLIGKLTEQPRDRVRTLAFWQDGELRPPFEYALADTPCEHVVAGEFCFYPENVAARFPSDRFLIEHAIEGYMGEPIRDASGRTIGLINACFRKPLPPETLHEQALFRLIAARSALEIERRAYERRIRQLNRTYALLSEINQTIVRTGSPGELMEQACRIAVEVGGFQLAWIGLLDEDRRLKLHAHAGADAETLALLRRFIEGPRPDCVFTFEALQTGQRSYTLDITGDERTRAWRAVALERGYRCLASLPLRIGKRVIGTFNLYADAPGFFDEEELRLLDELALDVGLGLDLYERERERRRAEQTLRENEERFRLLIEHAPDMIHVLDNQGSIRFESPSFAETLGYEPGEWIGRNAFELVHLDDLPRARQAMQTVIEHPDTVLDLELRLRHRDGSWRWIASTGRSLPDQDPEGFIVINSRDITETRLLEEQLRHAQKMEAIGRLAGGIAHDFNNLLTAVLGQIDLCSDITRLSPDLAHGLAEIRSHALRAADLTRQLLLFSRKQKPQPQPLDLNRVVNAVSGLLARLIGEDIELELDLCAEPLTIEADQGMLEQVLMNLAVNARDAMPGGGRLTIRTCALTLDKTDTFRPAITPGRYAVLEVRDTGVGIAREHLSRVFEPFFTTKGPGEGTGLGLATTFSIVEQHRGGIDVQSTPGKGACFRIALPFTEASPETASDSRARKDEHGAGVARDHTVLVVEDEDAVRMVIERALRNHDLEVLSASNAPRALELWKKHRDAIDLLVTDLVMPGGMSGEQLAARLTEEAPDLPVLYITGYSERWAARTIELAAHHRLLPKPFTPKQLLAAITGLLASTKKP